MVEEWLPIGDAAALLGVSVATLRRWADEGKVPHWVTPGGTRRFERFTLQAWRRGEKREEEEDE